MQALDQAGNVIAGLSKQLERVDNWQDNERFLANAIKSVELAKSKLDEAEAAFRAEQGE